MSDKTLFFMVYMAIGCADLIFFLNSFQCSGLKFVIGFLLLGLAHIATKLAFAEIK